MKTIRRRRLENKTDYKARLAMLKSEKARLVVRKTNRYIIAQVVVSDLAQDKVLFGANSKDLISKGWPEKNAGSLKGIPAAYLTGLMLGKMAKSEVKEAILDLGMQRNNKKSRLYAVLKGFVEAGVKVPHSEEALPEVEVKNPEIAKIFEKVKKELM
jgi:large subunit ribosomal protein L18